MVDVRDASRAASRSGGRRAARSCGRGRRSCCRSRAATAASAPWPAPSRPGAAARRRASASSSACPRRGSCSSRRRSSGCSRSRSGGSARRAGRAAPPWRRASVDLLPVEARVGQHALQRAFELAHVADRMCLAMKNATCSSSCMPDGVGLGQQDRDAHLELGRLERHGQAPAEARDQPLLDARRFPSGRCRR